MISPIQCNKCKVHIGYADVDDDGYNEFYCKYCVEIKVRENKN